MARNYNNPIQGSGVAVGVTYPRHSPVYNGATGDAYYVRETTTYIDPSFFTDTGVWARDFFWKPTIGVQNKASPRTRFAQFGDGYTFRQEDGVNTQMLTLDLKFEERADAEAVGILHFLHEKGGYEKFQFTPPPPYDTQTGLNFICREWNHVKKFKNNNMISATFQQVPEV